MPMGQVAYPANGGNLGREVQILASTQNLRWKVGGFTIDWTQIIGNPAALTIPGSGQYIPTGEQYARYGTIWCRLTSGTNLGKFVPFSNAMTATTVASGGTVLGVSTLTLTAVANINPGDNLLIDTAGQAETLQVKSVSGSIVTFTSPTTKTHANGVAVTKPDDGRQTLRRGECFLGNRTIKYNEIDRDQGPEVLDGGIVWVARVASDYASGVPTNPTKAQLETGMPSISWLVD